MPKGPRTYGSRVGRPKKRKKRKRKMNEQKLKELIGESVWNTYRDLAYILREMKETHEQFTQRVRGQKPRKETHKQFTQRVHGQEPSENPAREGRKPASAKAVKGRGTETKRQGT